MSIRGTLRTMSVADLLQFLAAGRKTGTLNIGAGTILKQIFLEDGLIVGSSSNDPKERLGQVLLHYGKINESDLRVGLEIQRRSGGRLGTILSSRGLVSQDDIMEVLRTRTLEIIYDLFIWEVTVTFRHLTLREVDLHTRSSTAVLLRGQGQS